MDKNIKDMLFKLSDVKYKEFSSSLVPTNYEIIGVRLPVLRKLAKKFSENWQNFIYQQNDVYFEEIMLKGMIIGLIKEPFDKVIPLIDMFVPLIDNWSVCDSFCSGLKFVCNNKKRMLDVVDKYLLGGSEFSIRFAVIIMLDYYTDDIYVDSVFQRLEKINHGGYYVKMAVAWTVSVCFVKFRNKTMQYLKNCSLDDFTYNKSLQKIIESNRVDSDTKNIIRRMKRIKN